MKPHEILQKRMEEFDENQIKWLSPDPLEPQYMIPDMKAIQSFSLATSLALIESFEEMVGGNQPVWETDNLNSQRHSGRIEGRNQERSRLRTLLREERDRIEKMV